MIYQIGIENHVEGRSLAWVLEHPGCFCYGQDAEEALAMTPQAITDYIDWVSARKGSETWLSADEIELHVMETWDVYTIDEDFDLAQEGYEVNAWFRHDWKPLTEQDVQRASQLLSWSREELLEAVLGLDDEALQAPHPGERWSIAGILGHVGNAELWYLDRLSLAFPWQERPEDPFERLEKVRARLVEVLPSLVGLHQVVGVEGEFWSPRKLVRRAVWHERDHTTHILKLR